MKFVNNYFSNQLRKALVEKKLTQKDLAEKLGVNKPMVSLWATGDRIPTVKSIQKIAAALEIPVSYFLEEEQKNIESGKKENDVSLIFELVKELRNSIEEKMKRMEAENNLLKKEMDFFRAEIKNLKERLGFAIRINRPSTYKNKNNSAD